MRSEKFSVFVLPRPPWVWIITVQGSNSRKNLNTKDKPPNWQYLAIFTALALHYWSTAWQSITRLCCFQNKVNHSRRFIIFILLKLVQIKFFKCLKIDFLRIILIQFTCLLWLSFRGIFYTAICDCWHMCHWINCHSPLL